MLLFWDPNKPNIEGKAAVHLEGVAIKKQENITITKTEMQKSHANKLHVKLGNPVEERICPITKHLQYVVKETLKVC